MFVVDEETAAAIRRAWEEGDELAGVVELRWRLPLIADTAHARRCARAIVGWGAPWRPANRGEGALGVENKRPRRGAGPRAGAAGRLPANRRRGAPGRTRPPNNLRAPGVPVRKGNRK